VSAQLDAKEISRAESDVEAAYIKPIMSVATGTPSDDVVQNTTANLAFLLLLQRSTFLTRAGAKMKTGYNSQSATDWEQLQDAATTCHMWLEKMKEEAGVANPKIVDICKIYFKTNYISM
jgi:hypothetical protein